MTTPTLSLIHGSINYTHTSDLTAFYPPQNLPTPWPLATASLIFTLAISCYGIKPAFLSWTGRLRRGQNQTGATGISWRQRLRQVPAVYRLRKAGLAVPRAAVVHESELEDLHKPTDDLKSKAEHEDPFADSEANTLYDSILEHSPEPKWTESQSLKLVMILICLYFTFRAVVALIINFEGVINNRTTASAPSILLLLLISTQIFASNRNLPRLMSLIFTIDTVLVSIAFLIASYAPLSARNVSRYGYLDLTGGTCAVYAGDCQSQASHWSVVGCANFTLYPDLEDDDNDETPTSKFYVPYATSGDINSASTNALHTIEAVIFVGGTAWLFTVLFQLYEARHLFTNSSMPRMLRPLGAPPQQGRGSAGTGCMGLVVLLGIIGAFLATIISMAGHMSQALGSHSTTYIDSIGAGTRTNFTWNSHHVATSSVYWGNATNWNDCFTVQAPRSGNGFWNQWVEQNSNSLYRLAAGL
jgi:hypothetical protein